VIDHLLLPGWTPWNAGPRGKDGPVDDVPPRSGSCGLNLDISFSVQPDNGGSEIAKKRMVRETVVKPLENYLWAIGDFAQSPQKSARWE
jgi:hypothetical protein